MFMRLGHIEVQVYATNSTTANTISTSAASTSLY